MDEATILKLSRRGMRHKPEPPVPFEQAVLGYLQRVTAAVEAGGGKKPKTVRRVRCGRCPACIQPLASGQRRASCSEWSGPGAATPPGTPLPRTPHGPDGRFAKKLADDVDLSLGSPEQNPSFAREQELSIEVVASVKGLLVFRVLLAFEVQGLCDWA